MPTGTARASWRGAPPTGEGRVALDGGAFDGDFGPPGTPAPHTDPEELLAGALASCFAMALSARMTRAGAPAAGVDTLVRVTLEKTRDGPRITEATVDVEVRGASVDDATLRKLAEDAFAGCPVAVALSALPPRLGTVRAAGRTGAGPNGG